MGTSCEYRVSRMLLRWELHSTHWFIRHPCYCVEWHLDCQYGQLLTLLHLTAASRLSFDQHKSLVKDHKILTRVRLLHWTETKNRNTQKLNMICGQNIYRNPTSSVCTQNIYLQGACNTKTFTMRKDFSLFVKHLITFDVLLPLWSLLHTVPLHPEPIFSYKIISITI